MGPLREFFLRVMHGGPFEGSFTHNACMVSPLREVFLRIMHGGPFEGSFLRLMHSGPFEGIFFTRNAWWAL